MVSPYFPDIMQGVVARVSKTFEARDRDQDPFCVFFDKGLYTQVSRNVNATPGQFPLVWLVMRFPEVIGKDFSIWGEVTARLILAMPTDNKYTQQQRDDTTYKPRLLKVYDQLLAEIARERWFQHQGSGRIVHTRMVNPFWGQGDVNGVDKDNLFKQHMDAIDIQGLKLRVRTDNCNTADYSVLPEVGSKTGY